MNLNSINCVMISVVHSKCNMFDVHVIIISELFLWQNGAKQEMYYDRSSKKVLNQDATST